jgi:hypothetical protein
LCLGPSNRCTRLREADLSSAQGLFKNDKAAFGPAELRGFAKQVKHVVCSNFAFAAELDGTSVGRTWLRSAQISTIACNVIF